MKSQIKPILSIFFITSLFLVVVILAYPPTIETHNPLNSEPAIQDSHQGIINPINNIATVSPTMDNNILPRPSSKPNSSLNDVIAKFNQYVTSQFPKTGIPGAAIAVIHKNQVIYLKSLGVKNVGNSDPINYDTIFQIGSCSKAFTATAVGAMIDDGKINWDDLARKYYPDKSKFSLYDPDTADKITIRQLLSHQSGLPEQAGTELVLDFYYDFDETLYRLRYLPTEAKLGTKYAYQNVLFSLAGQCSARASGMDWGVLMKNKIYQPLEMFSTVSYYEQYLKSKNRAGTHYVYNGVAYSVPPPNYNAIGPAGSISSSINDMAKWVIFQVNGNYKGRQIISSQSLKETHTGQIKMPGDNLWYGMGWVLTKLNGKNFYIHAGSTQYSSSYMLISPNDKFGVVVLANDASMGLNFGSSAAWQFIRYLNQKSSSPIEKNENKSSLSNRITTTDTETTPLPLKNYSGYYYSNYYGYIKIVKSFNSLKLYPGKNPNPVHLSHVKGNIFKDVAYDKEVIFSNIVNNKPQKVLTKRWEINGANGTFVRSKNK